MEDESEGISRKVVILYGSQTGCAEEVAERIGREARRRFLVPNVLAMDDYNIVCCFFRYCTLQALRCQLQSKKCIIKISS